MLISEFFTWSAACSGMVAFQKTHLRQVGSFDVFLNIIQPLHCTCITTRKLRQPYYREILKIASYLIIYI